MTLVLPDQKQTNALLPYDLISKLVYSNTMNAKRILIEALKLHKSLLFLPTYNAHLHIAFFDYSVLEVSRTVDFHNRNFNSNLLYFFWHKGQLS